MKSTTASAAPSTPPEQLIMLERLETLGAHMNALAELFRLIGEHTTGYAVVHPLSVSGQTIAANLTEDLYVILNSAAELSLGSAGVHA